MIDTRQKEKREIIKDKYNKDKDPLIVMNGFNESKIKPMLTKAKFVNIDKYNNSMPDVRGMSIRKAKKVLLKSRLRPKFSGSGKVVWQRPKSCGKAKILPLRQFKNAINEQVKQGIIFENGTTS